jgi:transposase InsO family protein
MDICGPYDISARKNKYILNVVDYLTKYAEAIPIPDCTAQTCARAYATQVIARHGVGGTTVTGRGSNFMSSFFNKTCQILGVKHVNTTAYRPQANGAAERFQQTLNRGLSYYVNASGTNWDQLLPFYLMT